MKKQNPQMSNIATDQKDVRLSTFVAAYFFVSGANLSIKQLISFSPEVSSLISRTLLILLGGILLLSIGSMLRRRGAQFFLAELVFLFLYLLSCLMGYAETDHLLKTAFWTLGVCLPVAFCAHAIEDKQVLLDVLRKSSYVLSPILWLSLYHMKDFSSYSMPSSYALLLPILLFFQVFFQKQSKIDFLFALAGCLMILLFGARGPLLCIAFYILVQLLFLSKRRWLRLGLIAGGGIFFLIFLFERMWLVNLMLSLMRRFNIYSRTLHLLVLGKGIYSSGRDELFSYYWDLIMKKPITGWGLLGGWLGPGSGPHNMLLELLLAFGLLLGSVLCVGMMVLLCKMFLLSPGSLREIIVVFAAYNFSKYLIAGFFLDSPPFFVFVILALSGKFYFAAKPCNFGCGVARKAPL